LFHNSDANLLFVTFCFSDQRGMQLMPARMGSRSLRKACLKCKAATPQIKTTDRFKNWRHPNTSLPFIAQLQL
jgi:hypothetical protein